MGHDQRLLATSAFRAGVQWAIKEMAGGVAEGLDRAVAKYLMHEEFPGQPQTDPETVAHSLPGRMRLVE